MDILWTPWRYAYITQGTPARAGVPAELASWPGDTGCVFCNMLQATAHAVKHGMAPEEADRAAHIVLRDSECFIVLNAFPYTAGHSLIVPYEHQGELHALPTEAAAQMMALAQRVDRALRSVYQPDGVNFGLNLGTAAGAGVAGHLHLHALPRWLGDTNFMTVVGETRIVAEDLDDTWRRLRHALAA